MKVDQEMNKFFIPGPWNSAIGELIFFISAILPIINRGVPDCFQI